ncbi:MAG: hypothetical protein ABEJ68_10080 [Halobacteriaceae archaeon]
MGKVSIGLRGWRFDESEVFDEDGNFRRVSELPDDARDRLLRLTAIHDEPCDACYLVHGDANIEAANVAEVVYGEPYAEVLLCADHERDFYYWYFEAGGEEHRGTERFQDEFHEWFATGNRAPEDYEGLEHVETGPADVPTPAVPDAEATRVELPEEERRRYNLREMRIETGAQASEEIDPGGDDIDDSDVDLDVDYPS